MVPPGFRLGRNEVGYFQSFVCFLVFSADTSIPCPCKDWKGCATMMMPFVLSVGIISSHQNKNLTP